MSRQPCFDSLFDPEPEITNGACNRNFIFLKWGLIDKFHLLADLLLR